MPHNTETKTDQSSPGRASVPLRSQLAPRAVARPTFVVVNPLRIERTTAANVDRSGKRPGGAGRLRSLLAPRAVARPTIVVEKPLRIERTNAANVNRSGERPGGAGRRRSLLAPRAVARPTIVADKPLRIERTNAANMDRSGKRPGGAGRLRSLLAPRAVARPRIVAEKPLRIERTNAANVDRSGKRPGGAGRLRSLLAPRAVARPSIVVVNPIRIERTNAANVDRSGKRPGGAGRLRFTYTVSGHVLHQVDRMDLHYFDPHDTFTVLERSLPHWSQTGVVTFITFRTRDSMPRNVVTRFHADRRQWLRIHRINPDQPNWRSALHELAPLSQREFYRTFSDRWNDELDHAHGQCVLKDPDQSKVVSDSLLHFDGDRYEMIDFIVMPNHVHLLAAFPNDESILLQCESWKHFTATQINRRLGNQGKFWQQDGFDHLVRSTEQLEYFRTYIAESPNKANCRPGESRYYRRNLTE